MMTAADPFTRADPLFVNAMRHAANTGPAFYVSGSSRVDWWKAAGLCLCLASAGLVVGLGAYFLSTLANWIVQ